MKWVLLGVAIAAEVTAALALQAAGGLRLSWWLLLVVAGYASAFVLLARVLARGVPLGVAYGIWAASGVALTAVMAHVFFDGPLNLAVGIGIALIVGGVVAVEVGSERAAVRPALSQDGVS